MLTLIDFRNFSAITHYFGDTILNCLIQGFFGLKYIQRVLEILENLMENFQSHFKLKIQNFTSI